MPMFDLRKLNASLPVPSVPNCPFEILVVGAKDDFIVVILCLKINSSNYLLLPPPRYCQFIELSLPCYLLYQ